MGNIFAENLKALRTEKYLSQTQVAVALGITQRKVSYLECGKIEPDLETLTAIAKYFAVTIDELVIGGN
jgi:transcriptional regulator with XRE-family HTH domain